MPTDRQSPPWNAQPLRYVRYRRLTAGEYARADGSPPDVALCAETREIRFAGESILRKLIEARRRFDERAIMPVFAVLGIDVYEQLCVEVGGVIQFPNTVIGLQIVVIDSPGALFVAPATRDALAALPLGDPDPLRQRAPVVPPSDHGIDGAVPLPAPEWEIPAEDGPEWAEQNRRINDLLR